MTSQTSPRRAATNLRNWTGTVHYAAGDAPACGPVQTHRELLQPTAATVTCQRCIARFGADEPGHEVEPPPVQEHVARRAAERAARRAAREAQGLRGAHYTTRGPVPGDGYDGPRDAYDGARLEL